MSAWLLVLGCGGSAGDDTSTTGSEPDPPDFTAECRVASDNALRVRCEITLAEPASATVSFDVEGEGARLEQSRPASTSHVFTLWDLPAETRVSWQVATADGHGASGEAWTGEIPRSLALTLDPVVDGPTGIERVVMPWACGGGGYLVVTDGDGQLRWYHRLASVFSLNGFTVSDQGSVLAMLHRGEVTEISWDGTVVRRLLRSTGQLPLPVHHDLVSRHGQTLVLNARPQLYDDGSEYILDGLFELSDDVAAPVWDVGQILDPRGLTDPGSPYWIGDPLVAGVDFGHANSVDVDERGVWLVSFKHLDTVMAIQGHPDAPDRGAVLWQIVGSDFGVSTDTDLALGSNAGLDASFGFQHHARWEGPDRITLFDNGRTTATSRVLVIDLDTEARTADVAQAFDLGERCPFQSSGYLQPDGSMVAACTSSRTLHEFDPDGTHRRAVTLTCPTDQLLLVGQLLRAIPLQSL
ncbi:MAG: aryl-sulfate sulfotransferase [Myxococcales bacterium]|nr:aryl-sulfate sulfotransferase [Myxococcales bacterium]